MARLNDSVQSEILLTIIGILKMTFGIAVINHWEICSSMLQCCSAQCCATRCRGGVV